MSMNFTRLIFHQLGQLKEALTERKRQTWQQSLQTRFENCGEGVYLSSNTAFVYPERIKLGKNVHIGANGWFQGFGSINIGDNVHISRNCAVFSANHDYESKRLPYDDAYVGKPVFIGRNTWIGMNVMIIPGVTIGEGAIIGLGTVVVKDVPSLAIVGGQGHRILGYRDQVHYQSLDQLKHYGGRGGIPFNE